MSLLSNLARLSLLPTRSLHRTIPNASSVFMKRQKKIGLEEAIDILRNKFHLDTFRPLQRAAINAVMSKEDAVVILSTGGGKSLCYQLPALLANGLTLVVSPLVSLVEDQILQLRKLGINASSLNANTSMEEEEERVEEAITRNDSELRLLYVTPEKLAKNERVMNLLEKWLAVGFLKLIAIDEVHCCSQWGHGFRTDYRFLNVLKRQFKGVPILGLTATANSNVLDDVKDMLGIQAALVFRAGFNRSNLKYQVLPKKGTDKEFVEDIATIIKRRFSGETGIIYCLSKNDCEKVAESLKTRGIRAEHYHADMKSNDRSACHQSWISGEIQVIVATVAFGMGIDKPDVRFVIHHSQPKSIENYYQESGMAGRDGRPATCILYYRLADVFRQSSMVQRERTGIANLYNMVRYAYESRICTDGEAKVINVSQEAKAAVNIIEENRRITGNKLFELLAKRLKETRSREFCERLIVFLLLESYLQEVFYHTKHTAYPVRSYVVVGSKWRAYNGRDEILMTVNDETGLVLASSTKSRKRKAVISSDEAVIS